jgi:hypothetical protein
LSGPKLGCLTKPMKAFQQENDPPFLGDIRPTIDLPVGFDLDTLADFQVWDGAAWRNPQDLIYKVQE